MGTFRLALSLLVVASHLGGMGDTPAGGTAVAAFFAISGFLMARTIEDNYSGPGYGRFYLNRLIRLGPPLAVVMGLSALLLWVRDSRGFQVALQGPPYMPVEFPPSLSTLVEWGRSGFPNLLTVKLYLLPQGWSLVVEGIFYLLAPLGVWLAARGYQAALWVVVALSFGLAVISTVVRGDLGWLRSPSSSLWVFLLGMLAYFHARRNHADRGDPRQTPYVELVPMAIVLAMGLGWTPLPLGIVLLVTPWIVVVWLLLGRWASRPSGRIDRILGDTAYGVFVGHFLSVMAMLWIAEEVYERTGIFGVFGTPDRELLHVSAYVASMLGGVLIYWSVERPFLRLRTVIRQRRDVAA
jgi:peptidoglycan/LPS O-acetylase OafA/YrhL